MAALYPSQGHRPNANSSLWWWQRSPERLNQEKTNQIGRRQRPLCARALFLLLQLNLDNTNWISRIKKWQEDPLSGRSVCLS